MQGVECTSLLKEIENNALYLVTEGSRQGLWKSGIECPSIKQKTIFLVENGQPKAIVHMAWASAKQWIDCPCNR